MRRIFTFMFAIASVAAAQQPQTQTAPIYPVNAKYANGVAPGYAPTAGSGLTLNLSAGTADCGGTMVTYSGGTLTMTASSTNYIYLNAASSCVPASNTTGVVNPSIPIAVVTTSGSAITAIADDRTIFREGTSVGTAYSLNAGSSLGSLAATGFMPQACADTSGSPTAQSCTTANSFTPQPNNCLVYSTTTSNSGTGLTINVNSLGAKSVAVAGVSGWTTTLTAGQIPSGKPIHLCYDGTNWDASGTGITPSSSGSGSSAANYINASSGYSPGSIAGCTLNSSSTGGGTVESACAQAQLDYLGANGGGVWNLDGWLLLDATNIATTNSVDGNTQSTCLQTHSNVHIQVQPNGGIFLKNSSNCTILGNNIVGNPSATLQTNMSLDGCNFYGNNANQSQYEQGNSAYPWNFGIWFGGFNGLTIKNCTLTNVATFNFVLSNGKNALLDNDTETEVTTLSGDPNNQDGIHFWGTLTNIVVRNFTDNGGDDDPIALNTDEGVYDYNGAGHLYQRFPWSGGSLSNILFDGFTYNGTSDIGRLIGYSTTNGVATLSNIAFRNFQGTVAALWNNSGITSCSNIFVDNWTAYSTSYSEVVPPPSSLSGCSPTPGQSGFGVAQTASVGAGGWWQWLDPAIGAGNGLGFYAGKYVPGTAWGGGAFQFIPATGSSAYWNLQIQGTTTYMNYYGTGDFSLSGSDESAAIGLPTGGGIKQHSGGSSTKVYATDGSTATLPSGTTTDALTAAITGGAAPGSTFNGSAAVTYDYHSFGAPGLAASTNTYSGATNDFSGTSVFKLPVVAGCVTTANGELCYDSTNKNWHLYTNGVDEILAPLAAGFVSGDCGEPTETGTTWTIEDAGGTCGVSGGGAAFSSLTSGSNGSATMTVATGASIVRSGTGHIDADLVDSLSPAKLNACTLVSLTNATCSGGVITVTNGSSSFTISSIPTTGGSLDLDWSGESSTGDSDVDVRFASDSTTGDYKCFRSGIYGSTPTVLNSLCSTVATSGTLGLGFVGNSSAYGGGWAKIINYASTTTGHYIEGQSWDSTDPGNFIFSGSWLDAAAMTSILFTLDGGGNFENTTLHLYINY